jgi:hypothetical protein
MNRDDVIRMYEKANGWSPENFHKTVDELERFANLIAKTEREECAKIVQKWLHGELHAQGLVAVLMFRDGGVP